MLQQRNFIRLMAEHALIALDVEHFSVEHEGLQHSLAHSVGEKRPDVGAEKLFHSLDLVLLQVVTGLAIREKGE